MSNPTWWVSWLQKNDDHLPDWYHSPDSTQSRIRVYRNGRRTACEFDRIRYDIVDREPIESVTGWTTAEVVLRPKVIKVSADYSPYDGGGSMHLWGDLSEYTAAAFLTSERSHVWYCIASDAALGRRFPGISL